MTDLMLPGQPGLTTIRALRQLTPVPKILALTGALEAHRANRLAAVRELLRG